MARSPCGKHNHSRESKPGRSTASLIVMLWLFANLLSSEQADCGTKKVASTCMCCVSFLASSLFIVDKPPLHESHSLAKRVTFKTFLDIFRDRHVLARPKMCQLQWKEINPARK